MDAKTKTYLRVVVGVDALAVAFVASVCHLVVAEPRSGLRLAAPILWLAFVLACPTAEIERILLKDQIALSRRQERFVVASRAVTWLLYTLTLVLFPFILKLSQARW